MRPLEHIMSISNSQLMKLAEPDNTVKHAHQMQVVTDEHIKHKESVSKIPDEEHTELMDNIKHGMESGNQEFHSKNHESESKENIPDKELLDENHGNNIDLLC